MPQLKLRNMFLKTIIDETTELTDQEARFASILDFVADDSDNGIFYLFKDWVVRMAGGESTKEFRGKVHDSHTCAYKRTRVFNFTLDLSWCIGTARPQCDNSIIDSCSRWSGHCPSEYFLLAQID